MNEYKPWEEYPHIWRTESSYLTYIRGGIRRSLWSKNPIKLEFEKERTVPMPNTNPRSMKRFPTVAGGCCELCGGLFRKDQMEVDHRTGEHSLRTLSDLESFIHGVVFVRKEDLAYLCKPCHSVKTHMERQGFETMREAAADKKAIEIDKKSAKLVVDFLKKSGIVPASKKELRRKQLYEHFLKESEL